MTAFSETWTCNLLVILCPVLLGITVYFKWAFTYWNRRGLHSLPPSIPFGNATNICLGKAHFGKEVLNIYNIIKKNGWKHAGVYLFTIPVYIPVDPDIIKHILQVDFSHFMNHNLYIDEKTDPVSQHLIALRDEKWKKLRAKLTPTFSSGKIKKMFQTLVDCTHGLEDIMEDHVNKIKPVDIKELLSLFSTVVISSCAFGIECDVLKNPDSKFRMHGFKAIQPGTLQIIKAFLQIFAPYAVLRMINFRFSDKDVNAFFTDIVTETVKFREQNNIERKDFLELLMKLKNVPAVKRDEMNTSGLSMEEIVAQCVLFFFAGFETGASSSTFTFYELAKNQNIQKKLRDEIHRVLQKHGGKVTYEAVMEMKFMDKVIQESLRKYPPIPLNERVCNKRYTIPGTSVTLEKGTHVLVPTMGLHRDPEYYPNPEVFDPDRFNEESKSMRHPFTWIPFGEGPRICLGSRFGMLQIKVSLIAILKNYEVFLNEKTKEPLEFSKKAVTLTAEGGVWLDVQKTNR